MTRVVTDPHIKPDIGLMRHPIIVCTTVERPDLDVSTDVKRPGVIKVYARISQIRGEYVLNWQASASLELRGAHAPTHEIIFRQPPDVKVDRNHWIYSQDKYRATWFKVVNVEDLAGAGRFIICLCAVDTVKDVRSDPATQPLPPKWETPSMDDTPPMRIDEVI